MAKFSAKGAVITIDNAAGSPQDVSTDCISYDILEDVNKLDVTGFTDGAQNFIPGLPVVGLTFEFLYDTHATSGATTILKGILNSATAKSVTIKPESAGGTLSGEYMLESFGVNGTPTGEIKLGTAKFAVMGATKPAWA